MAYGKKTMAKAPKRKASMFKPCSGCPTPSKCKKAKKCMGKRK